MGEHGEAPGDQLRDVALGLAIAHRIRRRGAPALHVTGTDAVSLLLPRRGPGGLAAHSAERPPVWQTRHSSCRPSSVTTAPIPAHLAARGPHQVGAGTVLGARSAAE